MIWIPSRPNLINDYNPNPNYPLSQSGGNIDIYGTPEGFLQFSVPTEEPTPGEDLNVLNFTNKKNFVLLRKSQAFNYYFEKLT